MPTVEAVYASAVAWLLVNFHELPSSMLMEWTLPHMALFSIHIKRHLDSPTLSPLQQMTWTWRTSFRMGRSFRKNERTIIKVPSLPKQASWLPCNGDDGPQEHAKIILLSGRNVACRMQNVIGPTIEFGQLSKTHTVAQS